VDHDFLTRRDFVAALGSLGALWLAAHPAERLDAIHHARSQGSGRRRTLLFFTPRQAAEIDAFAARIIPTDETPGAREAGVMHFIDRSLTTWAKAQQPVFTDGLRQLPEQVGAKFPGQTRLAALSAGDQDEVLKSIEQTPFFQAMRFATICGMFALPTYGGNRNYAGWRLVGEPLLADFKAPFGWYDHPANRRALLGDGS
jgi:gluconate 2-dehydrogenase gamma chain